MVRPLGPKKKDVVLPSVTDHKMGKSGLVFVLKKKSNQKSNQKFKKEEKSQFCGNDLVLNP